PLLSGGTLAYWVSDEPITPKILPIALNMVALSILLFGNWWRMFAQPRRFPAEREVRWGPASRASPIAPGLHPSVKAASSARKFSPPHKMLLPAPPPPRKHPRRRDDQDMAQPPTSRLLGAY